MTGTYTYPSVESIVNEKIVSLEASKLTGPILSDQIDNVDTSKLSGLITDDQIESINGSKITGFVFDEDLQGIQGSKVVGDINGSQITGTLDNANIPASNVDGLDDVATSGAYSDLSGTPTLATVATSGSYSDLTGKPSLASVATGGTLNGSLITGTILGSHLEAVGGQTPGTIYICASAGAAQTKKISGSTDRTLMDVAEENCIVFSTLTTMFYDYASSGATPGCRFAVSEAANAFVLCLKHIYGMVDYTDGHSLVNFANFTSVS